MHVVTAWQKNCGKRLTSVSMDPGGNLVAAAAEDGSVFLFAGDGTTVWDGQLSQAPLSIHCGLSGQHVGLITEDGKTVIIDKFGELAVKTPIQFSADVMAFRPASSAMALANRYQLFRIARRDGRILKRGEVNHPVDFLGYSPRGSCFAAADGLGNCSILNSAGSLLRQINLDCAITGFRLGRSGEMVAFYTRQHGLALVNSQTLEATYYQEGDNVTRGFADPGLRSFLYLKPDGTAAFINMEEGTVTQVPVPKGCLTLSASDALLDFACIVQDHVSSTSLIWYRLSTASDKTPARKPRKEVKQSKENSVLDYLELD